MTGRDAATERQVRAARPDTSTWLAANAGSGKTRVLTDRVARLLLSGVKPQHILCLTYTKAAASEMQNRLFARLGEWAMLPDEELTAALTKLGAGPAPDLTAARTLFARAIEAPGGLKIQTIHSFCSSILRRFPLEAGVSPQFSEMEDRAADLLRAEIVSDMAEGPHASLIDALAVHVTDQSFTKLTRAICGHRAHFDQAKSLSNLKELFGLPRTFDRAALLTEVFLGGEVELIRSLLPDLVASGGNNQKAAIKLSAFQGPDLAGLEVLEDVFLTGAKAKEPFSAKIGNFPTKALREGSLSDRIPALEALMARVEGARPRRLALVAATKSAALHEFVEKFLPEYAKRKQARGWLDFDDLILKAQSLLNNQAVAAWVLFRLDGGIDHILVDEAQDTSPEQWNVVEKLAQEFTAGEGARSGVERTIFVVGDRKQSIYSFQGADPNEFDRMQREFARRLTDAGSGLHDLTLEYSFRSAPAILRLVDLAFVGRDEAGFPAGGKHRAFKDDLPGRVDLWPVVEKADAPEEGPWHEPVDRPSPQHHAVILADRIARRIRAMIDNKETIPDEKNGRTIRRPIRAGDVMILVQGRKNAIFPEVIRACKAEGLPIAGADRLKVGAELAVRDLGALLSVLATPEDDLSLAAALKSPLFGWDEQALFDLAHRRGDSYLWRALTSRKTEFADDFEMIDDLMKQADFLRPYDLIERILTRHHGRENLLARLGVEAEDGIDALLSQALAYERSEIPSLTGFLVWMQTDDLEIKRQMGAVGDMIRVMTVHGSKGLESPIVILPDTASRKPPMPPSIQVANGVPLWHVNADSAPPLLAEADLDRKTRQMNERQRLLYVAMTRAEKWLIVAAAGETGKADAWYDQIAGAMTPAGATDHDFEGGPGFRLEQGDWNGLPLVEAVAQSTTPEGLPEIFTHEAPTPPERRETLSPSDLGGAKALFGDAGLDEEAAKIRGTNLHRLFEHLPGHPADIWPRLAENLLPELLPEERAELLAEAASVLSAPNLSHVFAPDTLTEVPVTASIRGHRLHGAIDRLIIEPDRVLAVDFKTNATVPDRPENVPEGLLRQMGAYSAMLAQIWPDRQIDSAILWTRTAELMPLPHDLVSESLARTPHLDDTATGS